MRILVLVSGVCLASTAARARGDHGTGSPQGCCGEGRAGPLAPGALLPQAMTARVEADTAGGCRCIRAGGLAGHATSQFPSRRDPNRIRAQDYRHRVPLAPRRAARPVRLGRNAFAGAVNGVPFDPATGERWNRGGRPGWNIRGAAGRHQSGLDGSHAHAQGNGACHFHRPPLALSRGEPGGGLASGMMDGGPLL